MTSTPSAADRVGRTPFVVIAALSSLAGAVAIWLPFAWSTSPAEALFEGDLWYLAAPFLLAVPIAAAWIWTLLERSLQPGAQWAARVLAGCAMAPTALFYAEAVREANFSSSSLGEWLWLLVPLVLAAGWVALMIRWRPGRRDAGAPEAIALMEAAFLPNAFLCLVAFTDQRQIGWYVSIAVSAGFAAHVVATARRAARRVGPRAQVS
jgi:hypothetical protein